jgi:23S rRNA (adenine2503-C2)-methyltransferase
MELADLVRALAPLEPSPLAVRKLFARVHAHGAESLEDLRATPQVNRALRDAVLAWAELPSLSVVERRRAADGFLKYLFESPLGERVEAVRIPLFDTKYVVCVSSQVGCALACDFCATGRLGFRRNLLTWEILDQVRLIRAEADRRLSGVVFMGMGEPLLNPTEVLRAARILAHPAGYAISGKAITLSTAGWVPAIDRYVREGHPYRLAFSVTSAIRAGPPHAGGAHASVARAGPGHRRLRPRGASGRWWLRLYPGVSTGREDAEALRDAFAGVPIKLDLIEVTDPPGGTSRRMTGSSPASGIGCRFSAPPSPPVLGGRTSGQRAGRSRPPPAGDADPPPARFPRSPTPVKKDPVPGNDSGQGIVYFQLSRAGGRVARPNTAIFRRS